MDFWTINLTRTAPARGISGNTVPLSQRKKIDDKNCPVRTVTQIFSPSWKSLRKFNKLQWQTNFPSEFCLSPNFSLIKLERVKMTR